MYSKALSNKDIWRSGAPYIRSADRGVELPVNYVGTAFNSDGTVAPVYSSAEEIDDTPHEKSPVAEPSEEAEKTKEVANAARGLSDVLSNLGKSIGHSKSFPFGHGLGFEELLLIGLILFLSDGDGSECDTEEQNITRLILAALLFCG